MNLTTALLFKFFNVYLREACIESMDEAIAASRLGADRLEFCSNLEEDGLTPDFKEVKLTLEKIQTPIMVMIRPRAGNFEYSVDEFKEMKAEIEQFKTLDIKGVVFGLLSGQSIDYERTKELAELAYPLEVCFHKAIDEVDDPVAAIKLLNKIPEITRILTSGQKATAVEGLETLKLMMQAARKDLSIMPAGKVKGSNIDQIHQKLHAIEYHGRSILMDY